MKFFNYDSPIMQFLTRLTDLFILNFLFLICSIPIITIGASATALYSVTHTHTHFFIGFTHLL